MKKLFTLFFVCVVLTGCNTAQRVVTQEQPIQTAASKSYPKLAAYSVVKDGIEIVISRMDAIPSDLQQQSSSKQEAKPNRLPEL